jgi:DHA1 family tetracycline resistance protein-like MFS transporter
MNRTKRSPLFLMALTIFIDFAGFGIILPLLPFWAERLGAGAVGVGLVLTIYALAQFIFMPVLGALSDRYGRRLIILASLLIEALSLVLSALAGSLAILLVARFIGGLGASNIGSAQAVVADVTPVERRAQGMGFIGAAIGLGFVVGPALGGLLAPLGPVVPFWVAMIIALTNALLVLRFLPETRYMRATTSRHPSSLEKSSGLFPASSPKISTPSRSAPAATDATVLFINHGIGVILAGWRQILRHPAVARLVVINLLFTLAFTAMEAVFPLFTQHAFGWTALQNGYIFAYAGIAIVLMRGGLAGRLVKRWGERSLLIAGLVMLAAGLALLARSTSLALLLIALGIVSTGDGCVTPMVSALLSFASPPGAEGETLGLAQGVAGLGRAIGPLAAGSIFAIGGPGAPFMLGSTLVVLAALIALPALTSKQGVSLRHSTPGVQTVSTAQDRSFGAYPSHQRRCASTETASQSGET